jgi:COP9 signalosome complex subunit 7
MEEPLLDTDSALAPFLELVEQSSVSTLRAVILKVLSHPQIFCGYDQLKAIVAPKADDAQLLATLDLFSYGVYLDYVQNPDQFLSLNDSQISKLRQLTVISSTHEACKRGISSVAYDLLAKALGLESENRRAVEQVIINCIYARILNGKLCQKSKQFHLAVPTCCSRDVRDTQISDLLRALEALEQRLDLSNQELEKAHTFVHSSLEESETYWKSVRDQAKRAQSQAPDSGSGGNSSGTIRSSLAAGWPADPGAATRRSSTSRQSKRSRGGMGFTDPNFQRL